MRLDTAEHHYALPPAARATALRVDPDYRLFRRLPLAEVAPIIRSLVVAPNAVTVTAGAESDVARTVATRLLEAGFQPVGVGQGGARRRRRCCWSARHRKSQMRSRGPACRRARSNSVTAARRGSGPRATASTSRCSWSKAKTPMRCGKSRPRCATTAPTAIWCSRGAASSIAASGRPRPAAGG